MAFVAGLSSPTTTVNAAPNVMLYQRDYFEEDAQKVSHNIACFPQQEQFKKSLCLFLTFLLANYYSFWLVLSIFSELQVALLLALQLQATKGE